MTPSKGRTVLTHVDSTQNNGDDTAPAIITAYGANTPPEAGSSTCGYSSTPPAHHCQSPPPGSWTSPPKSGRP